MKVKPYCMVHIALLQTQHVTWNYSATLTKIDIEIAMFSFKYRPVWLINLFAMQAAVIITVIATTTKRA